MGRAEPSCLDRQGSCCSEESGLYSSGCSEMEFKLERKAQLHGSQCERLAGLCCSLPLQPCDLRRQCNGGRLLLRRRGSSSVASGHTVQRRRRCQWRYQWCRTAAAVPSTPNRIFLSKPPMSSNARMGLRNTPWHSRFCCRRRCRLPPPRRGQRTAGSDTPGPGGAAAGLLLRTPAARIAGRRRWRRDNQGAETAQYGRLSREICCMKPPGNWHWLVSLIAHSKQHHEIVPQAHRRPGGVSDCERWQCGAAAGRLAPFASACSS